MPAAWGSIEKFVNGISKVKLKNDYNTISQAVTEEG